ncbi:MAG TPA: zf-HC2 domain-containing protein [Thermoanaerobaculaceae bacterium]|nr:zf-HC2 domain-containing protein [Thermoanaerobaculaceae bacterium]HRS17046.1 zf-HC2 domain-containing protein [Thermoanaerobaculaceae bacterium]
MTTCDLLRENLEAAVAGEIGDELRRHLEECAACREVVHRAAQAWEGGAMLKAIRAPAQLRKRLKAMPRLRQECEQAVELLSAALDGELDASLQGELLSHLRGCPTCQAAWEAMATLREVGSLTRAPARTRAALAIHPEHRLHVRRRRSPFDLRLATAAAYLLAAMTVFLLGNPAQIARAGNVPVERAAVYTRAAVENRFESATQRVRDAAAAAFGWAGDRAGELWNGARALLRNKPQNPRPSGSVVPDGNGGRS